MAVEHRLARLVHLGLRQARYFGHAKTKFQLFLAATVANQTLMAGKLGPSGKPGKDPIAFSIVPNILPLFSPILSPVRP